MASEIDRPKILVISGSVRAPSSTRVLSGVVADVMTALGAEVTVWDTMNRPLPIADPAYHKSAASYPDADVVALDHAARNADAFVLASPIYHNSYSGVLKNILDLLNIEPHFRLKPVGLLSHGGDRSTQAVDHLRIVARGLNAVAIPTQVCTRAADFDAGDEIPRLTDEQILARVDRFATELVSMSLLLRPLRHPDGVQRIIGSISRGDT